MGQMKQMNLGYHPVEDRFLFRIKTEDAASVTSEFRFWLTRRFIRLLWNSLEQLLLQDARANARLSPENRDAFMEFRQEAVAEKADFATPFLSENPKTPLGPTPLLLQGFRADKIAEDSFSLLLQATDKRSLTLNMDSTLLLSLRILIAREVGKAEWDLALNLVPGEHTGTVKTAPSIKLN